MRHALLCLALLAGCATAKPAGEQQPPPTTVQEAIERGATTLDADELPGLVIGVFHRGVTTWKSYGMQADSVDSDSLFRIASLTKPLVGLLLASYVVEGTLDYDERVGVGTCDEKKVSAFCFRGAATTYRHLLQHTSGLPTEPSNSKPGYQPADLQDFLARHELSIQPGARFRYSATGYAALGLAMTRVTREPFADAIRTRIVEPLGMPNTTFTPDPERLVPGHADGELVADPARPPVLWPSGGHASTPADVLHFAIANLQPDDHPGLSEALRMTQRTSSDVIAFDTSKVALGWFHLEALDAFWHAGSAPGYSTFVTFSPRTSSAIVIMANTSMPNDGRIARAAFEILGHLVAID